MPLDLEVQKNIVIYSLLSGVLVGLIFDFYRLIRGINKIKAITVIQDILFWILNAFIVFTFLLYTNYAFLTMYVYVFIIFALLVYLRFFSKYVTKIQKKIFLKIGKILRITGKNATHPIRVAKWKVYNKN